MYRRNLLRLQMFLILCSSAGAHWARNDAERGKPWKIISQCLQHQQIHFALQLSRPDNSENLWRRSNLSYRHQMIIEVVDPRLKNSVGK
ncbi:hypothetical protein B0H10DRAFT_523006 [Mycena sp. CBHHK59/15]|nr:hypothetical protein B0H10DRAFT_523006 [Mycena sp. CBHHK59/15]